MYLTMVMCAATRAECLQPLRPMFAEQDDGL